MRYNIVVLKENYTMLGLIYENRYFITGISIFVLLVMGLQNIFKPLVVSLILSFLFNKPVSFLAKNHIPRSVSSLGIVLIFFTSIFLFFWFSIPILNETVKRLWQMLPGFLETLSQFVENIFGEKAWLENLKTQLQTQTIQLTNLVSLLARWLSNTLTIGNTIYYFIITPFLIYYFTINWGRIMSWFVSMLPKNTRLSGHKTLQEMERVFFLYVKGQTLVSCVMIVLYILAFWVIGLKHPVFLGVIMGLAGFVPYVGTIVGTFLVAVFAVAYSAPFVLTLIVLFFFNILEGQVLTPKFIGKRLGMPPLILVLSIVIGHYYFGLLGMLLAYPVTATFANITGFRFFSSHD